MKHHFFSDAFLASLGFTKEEIWEYGRILSRKPVHQMFEKKAEENQFFLMKQLFLQLLEESVHATEQPLFAAILDHPLADLNVMPDVSGRYFILYDQQQMGYERIEVDEIKKVLFSFQSATFYMKFYRLDTTWFYDDKIRHHELSNQKDSICPVCNENFYAGFDDFICPSLTKISSSLYQKLFHQANFRVKVLYYFPGIRLTMSELLQQKGYTFSEKEKKWLKDA